MAIIPVNNLPPGPINALPEELTIQIFTDFTPLELAGKIMQVSRTWNRLASDPSLWRPKLQELNCDVIDEAVWLQHASEIVKADGISFEGLQPLDHPLAYIEVVKLYARLKAAETSIEDDKGVTILTIPKGLSINLVHAVFANRIEVLWEDILIEIDLGEGKTDQAYRVIATKNVLTGSRNKTVEEQRTLVEKAGCSLPKVLEAMVLTLLTEKSTTVVLFGDNPWTYTRCSEVINRFYARFPLIVGGFERAGLYVSNGFDCEFNGAAGVRKC